MKTGQKNKYPLFMAPLITLIILLAVYYAKGIYPFGAGTAIDYDLYQGGVPSLVYFYDAVHSGSFFYDFTTAGGLERNIMMMFLTPSNLFMLLFKRDMLINAVSLMIPIKLVVVAFCSAYSFGKIFEKLPASWVTVLSLVYTFCGYNLQYYTNIDWLDTVALYPLLILFALNMFKGKSKIPYFLVLSYLLLTNTYMAFFVVVSLVVFGGLYVFITDNGEHRRKSIYALGISTLSALIASGFSLYSFFLGVFSTARFSMSSLDVQQTETESTAGGITSILGASNQIEISSLLMFLGFEIAVAALVLLWVKFRKAKAERKYIIFFSIVTALLAAQVFFKGVNLLWHGGSYVCFPFRNGYMVGFYGCLIAGYYISRFDNMSDKKVKLNILRLIIPVVCAFSFVIIVPYLVTFFATMQRFDVLSSNYNMQTQTLILPFCGAFVAVIAGFILLSFIPNGKFRSLLSFLLIFITIGFNTYSLFGCASTSEKAGQYNGYYADCAEVRQNLITDSKIDRVNNPDLSLITNYPYLTGVSAVSNWTHSLSNAQINSFSQLGFSAIYTRTLDSGATVFSKAITGITKSVSKAPLDSKLYNETGCSDRGFYYYDNNYILPFGIDADGSLAEISYNDCDNTFEYQNIIFNSMYGVGQLFEEIGTGEAVNEFSRKTVDFYGADMGENDICTSTLKISASTPMVIYFDIYNKEKSDCYIDEITVNGEKLLVSDAPDISEYDKDNTKFPIGYNNNILELGTFENEEVTLEFKIVNGSSDDLMLYSLDLEKMQQLVSDTAQSDCTVDKDEISLSVNGKNDGDIVYLPVAFNESFRCTVNGSEVTPVCVLGNFTGIKIDSGSNQIVLRYSHSKAYKLLTAVVVCFAFALLIMIMEKRIKSVPEWALKALTVIFALLLIAALSVLYGVPIGYVIVKAICSGI